MNAIITVSLLRFLLISFSFLLSICVASSAASIYEITGSYIDDGEAGRLIELQRGINQALVRCKSSYTVPEDGRFGRKSTNAVIILSKCDEITSKIRDVEVVARGVVTDELWHALVPEVALPSVEERIVSLLLAFEATDYDHAEWNFCQNKPFYAPSTGQRLCYSNDKRSYITWGPNGATAGWGKEVLAIAAEVDARDPNIISSAFGSEAISLRKAISLDNSSDNSDLEVFLCGIWLDPLRKDQWKSSFNNLGQIKAVRDEYDKLYRSSSYDGGKIETFFRAWKRVGLSPTEVDFGFFIDRSAHTTPNEERIVSSLKVAKSRTVGPLSPSAARRAVALGNLPGNSNQKADRLGRDVTFYVDSLQASLSVKEQEAWRERGERRASNVGLSDERSAPSFSAGPPINWKPNKKQQLTESERRACPDVVLNPLSPRR